VTSLFLTGNILSQKAKLKNKRSKKVVFGDFQSPRSEGKKNLKIIGFFLYAVFIV
jgi:hypothetical protein